MVCQEAGLGCAVSRFRRRRSGYPEPRHRPGRAVFSHPVPRLYSLSRGVRISYKHDSALRVLRRDDARPGDAEPQLLMRPSLAMLDLAPTRHFATALILQVAEPDVRGCRTALQFLPVPGGARASTPFNPPGISPDSSQQCASAVAELPVVQCLSGSARNCFQSSGPDVGMKILVIPVILGRPRAMLTAARAKLRPRTQRRPQFGVGPADSLGLFSRSFLDRLRILYGDRWARRCRRNWPAGVRKKCDMLCHCKLGLVNAALYGMPNSRKTGQIRREVREEVRLFRCLDTKGVREIYH